MKTVTAPKKGLFVSLRLKLLIGFTLLFSLVFAGAFYWFLSFATDSALGQVEADMLTTLDAAVAGINGDTFAGLAQDGSAKDARYIQHLNWLKTIHSIEPRAFIYTYVAGSEANQILFIGDTLSFVRPDDAAAFREPYTSTGPMVKGLKALTLNLEAYSDEWGRWISAYKPILDSAGKRVGAVGVDFEANYVDQVRQGILDNIVLAFAITYTLLFVMVFLISRALTRPIAALTSAAERIGEGHYQQDLSNIGSSFLPDEIYKLARVFEIMVNKVRTREETLKKEVAELRIELDESKRNEQVTQIVESDFFRELQEKARAARARKNEKRRTAEVMRAVMVEA